MTADLILFPVICGATGLCSAAVIRKKLPALLFEVCDIESALLDEKVIKSFREKVNECVSYFVSDEEGPLLKELSDKLTDEKLLRDAAEKAADEIAGLITERLSGEEIQDTFSEEAASAVREKLKNSFFGSIVSDRLIAGMTKPVGAGICRYLREHAGAAVREDIFHFADSRAKLKTSEICSCLGINKEYISDRAEEFYRETVKESLAYSLTEEINGIFRKKGFKDLYIRAGLTGVVTGLIAAALKYIILFLYF